MLTKCKGFSGPPIKYLEKTDYISPIPDIKLNTRGLVVMGDVHIYLYETGEDWSVSQDYSQTNEGSNR